MRYTLHHYTLPGTREDGLQTDKRSISKSYDGLE